MARLDSTRRVSVHAAEERRQAREASSPTIEPVHERYAGVAGGALADFIPELTRADPTHCGITLVTADEPG